MEEILLKARGVDGQLELLRSKVRIRRIGMWGSLIHGLRGDKEVFLDQISGVQLKKAGVMNTGFIQILFLGSQDNKGTVFEAGLDENSVTFRRRQEPAFLAMKEAIEKRIEELRRPAPAGGSLDDLEKLAELRDRGIVTEEEFEAKKRQLLGI